MISRSLLSTIARAVLASAFLLQAGGADVEALQNGQNAPITLKQGSFFVGGEPFFTETGNDTDPAGARNPGTATINQTYVEYQVPLAPKSKYPLILLPGG